MSVEKPESNTEPEKGPERASDMELMEFAGFLMKHIDNPCEVEVAPGDIGNRRDFYLREAERLLGRMTDPEAKKILQAKIVEYKSPDQ
ncbi:MAG: hypothetical protein V2A55_02030 [Candidatus Jorgensenbacteria bacterium]